MDERIIKLDLRDLPPAERHGTIFELWDRLAPGQAILLINDHDPKPLYYQFAAEFEGKFQWHYEQEGPEDWIVTIGKLS